VGNGDGEAHGAQGEGGGGVEEGVDGQLSRLEPRGVKATLWYCRHRKVIELRSIYRICLYFVLLICGARDCTTCMKTRILLSYYSTVSLHSLR